MCQISAKLRHVLSEPCSFLCRHRMSVRHKQKKSTAVVYDRTCPTYDENFHFLVHFPEHQELSLKMFDHDRVWGDTLLGGCAADDPNPVF